MEAIVKKANQKIGIIARVFQTRSCENIIPLYVTFVRPLLEYNSVIWSPTTNKYDKKIEGIQKKMLNLLPEIRDKNLTYQQKLTKTKLLSLRARRIQHQLTIMFKMRKKKIGLCFEDFFQKNEYSKTRGNIYDKNA